MEKEYFLLKAISKSIEWITLYVFFSLIFISLLVFPVLITATEQGSHSGKNIGFGVRRSRLSLTSPFIHFVTLGITDRFVYYMR